MEYIAGLLCVLTVVTLVGHGIWVVIAAAIRGIRGGAVSGKTVHPRPGGREARCPSCDSVLLPETTRCRACGFDRFRPEAADLAELNRTEKLLRGLLDKQVVDQPVFDAVLNCIEKRRHVLLPEAVLRGPVADEVVVTALEVEPTDLPSRRLEEVLAGCQDPRALALADRERALSWHEQATAAQLDALSVPAQLALARLLASAEAVPSALHRYRRVLSQHGADGSLAEEALEAGCLAAEKKEAEQARWFLEKALAGRLPEESRHEAEELLRLCAPETKAAPVAAPRPPRRSIGELLAGFMEEKNILWGELVGGLLMVGCSIALVISLWKTLEQIPYFPFVVFAGLTAAIFGAGFYTLSHWKLESTSRGLLMIALLLVPLDFLVLAGLSRADRFDLLDLATKAVALTGFTFLASRAARVLFGASRWWLAAGLVGIAASQLLVPRLLSFREVHPFPFALLGALPTVCEVVACGAYLLPLWQRPPDASRVKQSLAYLGVIVFAVLVAFGFLTYWDGNIGRALEFLAPSVAAAAIPVLLTGVLLHTQLAGQPWASLRTVGTALALGGMVLMLAALAFAWPQPWALIAVALLIFGVFTVVGFWAELPVAHAAAIPCFTLACLVGYHAGAGHVDVDRAELSSRLATALASPQSGSLLVGMVGMLALAGGGLVRLGRRVDGAFYSIGAGCVALLSLVIVSLHGVDEPFRAAWVTGLYAIGALAVNLRWRRVEVNLAGFGLLVVATLWGLHEAIPGQVPLWTCLLAAESLLFAAGSLPFIVPWDYRRAGRDVAAATAALAVVLALTAADTPHSDWYTVAGGLLAAAIFCLVTSYRFASLTYVASALLLGTGWHACTWTFRDGNLARPATMALLIHATFAAVAVLLLRRRAWAELLIPRLYSQPLAWSGVASSTLAGLFLVAPVLLGWTPRETLPLAGYGIWLGALWLAGAWHMRRPGWFIAGQFALAGAVLYGVTAWLQQQPWVGGSLDLVRDLRSLLVYAAGLAAFCLAWSLLRIGLRPFERVRALLAPPFPTLDEVLVGLLVVALTLALVGGLAPLVVLELQAVGTPIGSAEWPGQLFSLQAWWAWASLAAALLAGLWDRRPGETVVALSVMLLPATALIAAVFAPQLAAASALRWGLAVVFVGGSLLLWLRRPVRTALTAVGACRQLPQATLGAVRAVLLFGAAVAIGLEFCHALGAGWLRVRFAGPLDGSFFQRIGLRTSHLVPLGLLTIGFAGYALRERSRVLAFVAGVGVNGIASFLLWSFYQGQPLWTWAAPLAQVNTIVFALVSLLWLHWKQAGKWLIRSNLTLAVLGNAVILGAAMIRLVLIPERPSSTLLPQAGALWGWLAWSTTCLVFAYALRRTDSPRLGRLLGFGCLSFGILVASVASRWDKGDWLAYHVLMTTWCLASVGLLVTGWRKSRLQALFSTNSVQRWVALLGFLVVALALGGGWSDPGLPYWSMSATATVSLVLGGLAIWERRSAGIYASGLVLNVAGLFAWAGWVTQFLGIGTWFRWGPGVLDTFWCVNVLGLALGSAGWFITDLVLRRRHIDLGEKLPYRHVAALVAVQLLAMLVFAGLASDLAGYGVHVDGTLPWLALAATAIALLIGTWDQDFRFGAVALHVTGVLCVGLALHAWALPPRELGWHAGIALAAYVLSASALGSLLPRFDSFWQGLRLPDRAQRWPGSWFPIAQILVAGLAAGLSLWISQAFPSLLERLAGPLAVGLLIGAGVFLADAAPSDWRRGVRSGTLCLGVLLLTELGWSCLNLDHPAPWLHRTVLVMIALVAGVAICAIGLPRLLPRQFGWIESGRQVAVGLAVVAAFLLVPVLTQEFLLFDLATKRTPMAAWAVATVALALAGLTAMSLHLAISPRPDPLGLDPSRRGMYVYAGEALLVLLLIHIRLNVPWLFPKIQPRVWPFAIMAIAFLGAGLSEWFRRRALPVLVAPLRRTGLVLPILPLLAFWARPPEGLYMFAEERLPGLVPLLSYLRQMEHHYADHAAIWMILGLMLAFLAGNQRSFRLALCSALAANFGLWSLLHHTGLAFFLHPQLWLIPMAAILLVAEQLNRDRLASGQALTLRYAALLLLYVSSTADMFITGLGNSLLLPIVLAVLAILGVLAGILLRVRAFLVMGVAFLFLDVFSMIWHAAVDRYQTWVWWVSGIVLGAAIIALFAVFEKRRQDLVKLMDEVKQWK